MKYVCLGYFEEKKWDAMSQRERDAFTAERAACDEALRNNCHKIGGASLQRVRTATTLRWEHGRVAVAEGPFAETREQLGGILVLEANDLNHVIQLMSQHPGIRLGGCCEIRPIEELNPWNRA